MRVEPLVLGFPDYQTQSQRLAAALNTTCEIVDLHRFPDGESKVRMPVDLPQHIILCRSLNQPNDKLIEIMLCARHVREQGVRHLTLVAPYLCYMRQDCAFLPGEVVSQHIIGDFLAGLFDAVITVDPHLHRISRLGEAVPAAHAIALSTAPLMGDFLRAQLPEPLLIGPDSESEQWVGHIAERCRAKYAVGCKQRAGDRSVSIALPEVEFRGRTVVLVDDIVSTGHTLATAAQQIKALGAAAVYCLVSHALFAEGAEDTLGQAGVERIWSTDSIPHSSNAVTLAGLLAQALPPCPSHPST